MPDNRPPTFTESARRDQIVGLTIDLIAEHGIARTTLARIAGAAQLSNAAVLYFFGTKNAVIDEACRRVTAEVVDVVATAVGDAPTARKGIDAYVRSLIGHMTTHPAQVRVVIEMLTHGTPGGSGAAGESASPAPSRWPPVAELIERAQADGDIGPIDARTTAIALIGSTDAIFAESLVDPAYDTTLAVDQLLDLFDRATSPGRA